MGKEVENKRLDDKEFFSRLKNETKLLKSWFVDKKFAKDGFKTGVELEAWLVDENMLPDPYSSEFLENLGHDQVVPEIAKFNFEINSSPYSFSDNVFSSLEKEMTTIWNTCFQQAKKDNKHSVLVGTLPTLRPHMLSMEYLSPQNRYAIMNDNVMKLRDEKPMYIRLEGKDQLYMYMDSVISECAATSLQIHLGVTQENAKRYYNASQIASAFLIAVSANSPYFFGRELWDESRIAIFEQSVDLESQSKKDGRVLKRVTLGSGYIKESLFELFEENFEEYPILLSELSDGEEKELNHLRLHNGTIWRWTRPIIGDDGNGNYHLRIEQRTPSAGPTVKDSIANTAFYIGLVDYLANMEIPPEDLIPFHETIHNFYKASRQSFFCRVMWVDGKEHCIRELIQNEIFPHVKSALKKRGVSENEIKYYMDEIMYPRVERGINGAVWQKAFIHMHGKRFQELMERYIENQQSGKPIHEWEL